MNRSPWRRLSLILLILAAAALASCKLPSTQPSYEFDGTWSGSLGETWVFNQDGGTYTSGLGVYSFDFTYTSVDEPDGKMLLMVTKVSGLPPAFPVNGGSVYVMYTISGSQPGDVMDISFNPSYVPATTSDGPFVLQ